MNSKNQMQPLSAQQQSFLEQILTKDGKAGERYFGRWCDPIKKVSTVKVAKWLSRKEAQSILMEMARIQSSQRYNETSRRRQLCCRELSCIEIFLPLHPTHRISKPVDSAVDNSRNLKKTANSLTIKTTIDGLMKWISDIIPKKSIGEQNKMTKLLSQTQVSFSDSERRHPQHPNP